MSAFKEMIESDIEETFIDIEAFAEKHTIDGKEMIIVLDSEVLKERQKKEYDDSYWGDILFFVAVKYFEKKPKQDSIVMFDGQPYTVFDIKEDDGVYEIVLSIGGS